MPMDPAIKKNWEELQGQYNYPVDALGRPIDDGDEETLNVWRSEGLDGFMPQ